MLKLSEEQERVIQAGGHLLVLGGPGSGKTTVATLKAVSIVNHCLAPGRKILFLSFARPTVSRIVESLIQTSKTIKFEKRLVEIETYHAFFWRLVRSHGYLLGLPRHLRLLTPAADAVALASIRKEFPTRSNLTDRIRAEKMERENAERVRLAFHEGRVCFDLFADLAAQLLHGSRKLRNLTSAAYPYIILDEFQDTNADQWRVVKALGRGSEVVALADPEQRIYEFIGADPERINHYRQEFKPKEFDLSDDNFRSADTDIAKFGNDVLKGEFGSKPYKGITALAYPPYQNQAYAALKGQVLKARGRLIAGGQTEWSLAVLVPTKKVTRLVSDYLRSKQAKMPPIEHSAAVDVEGAILAAEIIAFLLQPKAANGDFSMFVDLICNFYDGRGGATPNKTHITESTRISAALERALKARRNNKNIHKNSLILPMFRTYNTARKLALSGNPEADWRAIRRELENAGCKRLNAIAEESRNLRLLNRGTQLRTALSQEWRDTGSYENALDVVRRAFVQEHFERAWKPERGVVVMNMHKAKGKQFDEVIIFEGWPRIIKGRIVSNPDRIVRGNSTHQDLRQARQNLRVSVTRAKRQTTILTPKNDPCVLLIPDSPAR